MSSIQNRLLFSEIFFKQIRRETADLANLRATLATIRDTWRYYLRPPEDWEGPRWRPDAPFDTADSAALRDLVIQPIFGALELSYGPCEAQASLSSNLSAFFLYGDWAMQDRTGLCLVLPYSADIEGRDAKGRIPKGRNYAQQLLRLLREHDLDWGVLTNGRHWRLYHRTELSPTDTYLHLNLEQIVAADHIESYVIFHRFFGRSAFAQQDGRQLLDRYKEQSDRASKVIEDHLSLHVEELARQLCQGLVESCRAAGEDVTAPGTRKEIYKNALYLVYRLLFVLYAEARDLLPLDVPAYEAVCLRDLLAEVRENHWNGLRYAERDAIWERLQALFALIDQGKKEADVPAYNGGLFDPGRRPFLTGHRIENLYLQAALIRLSTMPAKGLTYDQDREPTPIDYRDLSVRHLGSLYEGLLEYNLFEVKDEPRVVRAGSKRTEYVRYSQAGKVRAGETVLKVGDVYFSETEGERKATGSYYTPEDVVDYIVRNTVMVKLAELRAEFYKAKGIERQLQDLADTPPDLPAYRQIQLELDRQFLSFVNEQVLSLKILDMAMGSGHFLVNSTHAVANFIVEFLNETPWENADIDTDVATWRRRVAERCIFGVDLNELAVELAKLCLWMTTAARGKPLTFLDHHLRWGNSLVGAWMKDVGVYPLAKERGKPAFTPPLGTFQVALGQVLAGYRELYALNSDDVEEVRQKARIYEQGIHPVLERYRELCDLHTGVFFGNGLDETAYARLGASVHDPTAWAEVKAGLRLEELLNVCRDQRWFHWELEFSEVFGREEPGFDVTIGNPPYVEIPNTQLYHYLNTALPQYSESPVELSGRIPSNTYAHMLEIASRALRYRGQLGYVVPNSSVCAPAYQRTRQLLRTQFTAVHIANFSIRPQPVFPGIMQRVAILLGARGHTTCPRVYTTRYIRPTARTRATLFQRLEFSESSELAWLREEYVPKLGGAFDVAIYRRIMNTGITLAELTKIEDEERIDIYFHDSGESYWTKALPFDPLGLRGGVEVSASGWGTVAVPKRYAGFVVCLLNSGFFYWYWLTTSDCRHLTQNVVLGCPIPKFDDIAKLAAQFDSLSGDLVSCYERNTRLVEKRAGYASREITVRNCKSIIDVIDSIVGQAFGFRPEWIEYLIRYDAECRILESTD